MLTRNSKKLLFFFFLTLFTFNIDLNAEEFNITAKEILLDKANEILIGKGSVEAIDSDGKIIYADKIIYEKTREFLIATGNVKIVDNEENILTTNKATYDKINNLIITYDNTELILKEGYKLISKNITYNTNKKILSSNDNSIFNDSDGNIVETSMFQYLIESNLFSSIGKIKITDIKKNKYFFKEIHIDTKKKEMIGSDVSVILDQESFGLGKESDPRLVANDILITKDKSISSKAVFTVCKIKKNKCPPWSLKAKKIIHDRIKKTIYYNSATLKIYDIPIFYFPKFFHPDPTVKRQSGFLAPFFTNSTTVGMGSAVHIFANLDLNFNQNESYESNLLVKVQRTSNDTYLKIHDINTSLVNSENTTLENEFKYSFNKSDMYIDIHASVFEKLEGKSSDRYEYILPNIMYGKTFFSEKFGTFDFKSNALYSNYDTNKYKTFLTNDVIWNPSSYFSKNGFVNTLEGMLRNTNYETKKTGEYKDGSTVNELSGVLGYKTALPMKKNGINYSNLFSPNFMIRYAPGHMRNLSEKDATLNYTNLYSLNKTSEIESGLSAILGIDYKINEIKGSNINKEKLSLSIGQVFNYEKNKDIPSKSSLDQKMSDVVGEINYNFSEIGKIDYKFSLDHNLNDFNYNNVSTELNFGKIQFNLGYLEQQNHIGNEHYASAGVTLNFNEHNKLSFGTKKNFKTDSTELYNLSYQYGIDCLTAGLVYRREFYQDTDDIEAKDSLMFTITFVPFAGASTPIKQ